MLDLTHSARASLLAKLRDYSLTANSIHWRDASSADEIAFADIDQVRLSRSPGFGVDIMRCKISTRSGRSIVLAGHHFKRFGVLEDRSAKYAPFVLELLRRIAAANPRARFLAGSTAMWFFWRTIVVLMAAILIFLVFALLRGASFPAPAYAVFAAFVIMLPGIFRALRGGRTTSFDPLHPPAPLLRGS